MSTYFRVTVLSLVGMVFVCFSNVVLAECTARSYSENIFKIDNPSCEQLWAYYAFLDTNAEWQTQADYYSKKMLNTIENTDHILQVVSAIKLGLLLQGLANTSSTPTVITDAASFGYDFTTGVENFLPPGALRDTGSNAKAFIDLTKQVASALILAGHPTTLNPTQLIASGILDGINLVATVKGTFDIGKAHTHLNSLILARLYLEAYYRYGMDTDKMIDAYSSSSYSVEDNDDLIEAIGESVGTVVFDDEIVDYFSTVPGQVLEIISMPTALVAMGTRLLDSADYDIDEVKDYIEQMQKYVDPVVKKNLRDDTKELVVSMNLDNEGYFSFGEIKPLEINMLNDGPLPTERISIKIDSLPEGFKLKLSDSPNEPEQLIPHAFELGHEFELGKGQYELLPGSNEKQIYYLEAPNSFQVSDIKVEVWTWFENGIFRIARENIHIYSANKKGNLQFSPSDGLSATIVFGDSYVENRQALKLINVSSKRIDIIRPIGIEATWLSFMPEPSSYDVIEADKVIHIFSGKSSGDEDKITFWPNESAYELGPGEYPTPITIRVYKGKDEEELYTTTFTLNVIEKCKFSDVNEESYYTKSLKKLCALGVIDGYDDGTFGVGNKVSRAEFLKIALLTYELTELAENQSIENIKDTKYKPTADVKNVFNDKVFTEAADLHWASGYINFATSDSDELGKIVQGYPDGKFHPDFEPDTPDNLPNGLINRAEAAKILAKLFVEGVDDLGDDCPEYNDISHGQWPCKFLSALKSTEPQIMKGFKDGGFGPWNPMTREDVAVAACRAYAYKQANIPDDFCDVQ